jgi:phosphopentomutase
LDSLKEKGMEVIGIGKIRDIYAGRGLTKSQPTKNNADGMEQTVNWLNKAEKGLVFTNLVDFDMKYGHRNDPWGYAKALEAFDRFLPKIIAELGKRDLLIITADHGCDPTTEGTDHSREYVPLLIIGNMVKKNTDLGIRNTFADVGATIAGMFEVTPPPYGVDMTKEII